MRGTYSLSDLTRENFESLAGKTVSSGIKITTSSAFALATNVQQPTFVAARAQQES